MDFSSRELCNIYFSLCIGRSKYLIEFVHLALKIDDYTPYPWQLPQIKNWFPQTWRSAPNAQQSISAISSDVRWFTLGIGA